MLLVQGRREIAVLPAFTAVILLEFDADTCSSFNVLSAG